MNDAIRSFATISQPPVLEGGAKMIRLKEGFNVWTKHVGPVTGPQILTLHGGPGIPHFYLECFESYLPRNGFGFWYYDQLGCGFSDAPTDPGLLSVERFRDEIEQVRIALGREQLTLYGHSWGAMLAIEYALHYPDRVSALILSNMTASISSYVAHLDIIRRSLSTQARMQLESFEATQSFNDPDYQQFLMSELYSKHICRLPQWPEPVTRALRMLSSSVYHTMNGPDEFHVVGRIKHWDRWKDLHRIEAPTLVLGARYDTMRATDLLRMGQAIPHARTVICDQGSHLAMYDDQQAYFNALIGFLNSL
jgi:proline iminopeptidase